MDLAAFTVRVHEVLKKHFADQEFEAVPEDGVIATESMRFGLANVMVELHHDSLSDEEFEQRIVQHFGQAFAMVQDDALIAPEFERARPRLRLQLANLQIPEFAHTITFPFSKEVCSAVVIDAPHGYAYVTKQNAASWDQTTVDLIEIARENLSAAVKETKVMQIPAPGGAGLMVVQESDGYAAARVLLPQFREFLIQNLAPREGFVWVGVPNRDFLIAWPDRVGKETQASIREQLKVDAKQQHHPLCSVPLRVTSETITPDE
jgi:uncharacterized protein YtpQ (UPF0354 family)